MRNRARLERSAGQETNQQENDKPTTQQPVVDTQRNSEDRIACIYIYPIPWRVDINNNGTDAAPCHEGYEGRTLICTRHPVLISLTTHAEIIIGPLR
jgi:hypothetical protein